MLVYKLYVIQISTLSAVFLHVTIEAEKKCHAALHQFLAAYILSKYDSVTKLIDHLR